MNNNIFSSYTKTVRELFRDKDKEFANLILDKNIDSIWESHDNWNGGIDYYHIKIRIPVKLFNKLKKNEQLEEFENALKDYYDIAMRGEDSTKQLNAVVLQPSTEDDLTFRENADANMWTGGYFRLFVSHLTANKDSAANLKQCLKKYGIDCFVAHEDIDVTKEWEVEIENALFSMDALCAIIAPDFIKSNWCDQEIGIAMGQKKVVIPIAKGEMPYGFIGKYQALKSQGKNANQIASEIWKIIIKNSKTRSQYFEKFISLIVNSTNVDEAQERIQLLKSIQNLDKQIVEIFHNQYKDTTVLNNKAVLKLANKLFSEYSLDTIVFNATTTNFTDTNNLPF